MFRVLLILFFVFDGANRRSLQNNPAPDADQGDD
jgi:hypothetical protein